MLAHRIIPVLLHKGNTLVKGEKFNPWRSVGHVQQAGRVHAMRGVDELVILNVGADRPDLELVRKLTEGNFCPVAIGGGIRSVQDVRDLLNAGADKVVIGPGSPLARDIAKVVGSQALTVSMNVLDRDFAPVRAKKLEDAGVGEILLQPMHRDGMMTGYDLELIMSVSEAVSIPVIASCGCGTYEHMAEAIDAGAHAVAAGAMFLFTDQTPKGAAQYLSEKGYEVRI